MDASELLVGDVAPEINVHAFLKGDPVLSFSPNQVYVVELWATWCRPCLDSIAHLTQLQATYPEVIIIGVAVTAKDLDELSAFVKARGDAIGYRIAADMPPEDGETLGWMHRNWGMASHQSGIPVSFVVDGSGRLAWIGHPMIVEPVLKAVIDGSHDIEGAAREHDALLRRNRVRESKHLEAVIAARRAQGDTLGLLRAFDDAFAAYPDMEATAWGQRKLEHLLATNPELALSYGRHLCDSVAGDDGNMLASLAHSIVAATTDSDRKPKAPTDGELASLAVGMLMKAELVLGPMASPFTLLRISQSLAKVLLEVGLPEEALQRALKARELGVSVGADETYLTQFDDLAMRCEAALC